MNKSDVVIHMVDEIAKELDCTSDVILENIVNFAWESIFGTMLERCQPGREEMADFLNCLPKRW